MKSRDPIEYEALFSMMVNTNGVLGGRSRVEWT